MDFAHLALAGIALAPAGLMTLACVLSGLRGLSTAALWRAFTALSGAATVAALLATAAGPAALSLPALFQATPFGLVVAVLVQLLGAVIGRFSARYLEGEQGQRRYLAALAGVLASVHLLLLADHWLVLVPAWAAVGGALQHLLCFYPDRPFARLAAHKKRLADRCADLLLLAAAVLAWREVGSGSLTDLWAHVAAQGPSTALQLCAACVAAAVILRTALLPVHGWLIQVMEAPTPVSALLHAGVVNLGGYILIRFAPLLDVAAPARMLLVAFGLATAVLAGMVMLTRISIKVRLAWSTVAQMGFMVLECGLGLYTLAALHLVGHSLYKAHAFLSASTAVRQARLQAMRSTSGPLPPSLFLAPLVATAAVGGMQAMFGHDAWPWWWSVLLGFAWAPLLWIPAGRDARALLLHATAGLLIVAGLTAAALLAHALPLGLRDAPQEAAGVIALCGMAALYVFLVLLQQRPHALQAWRRWSYAGFYVDEVYTRVALQLWPTAWSPAAATSRTPAASALLPKVGQ